MIIAHLTVLPGDKCTEAAVNEALESNQPTNILQRNLADIKAREASEQVCI
jgi:hypothetical protein